MSVVQLLFAVVIVVGILGAMALQNFGRQQRENRGQLRTLERDLGERMVKLEALEERIAVLEKIVTDNRFELDREFRKLEKTG